MEIKSLFKEPYNITVTINITKSDKKRYDEAKKSLKALNNHANISSHLRAKFLEGLKDVEDIINKHKVKSK